MRADKLLAAKGVDHLFISFTDQTNSVPAAWKPYAAGLADLFVPTGDSVFTVPLWPGLRLRWRLDLTSPYIDIDLLPLTAGEDRLVVIDLCLPPIAKISAPLKASGVTSCMGNNPDYCVCIGCSPMAPVKVTFKASGSESPGGKPGELTYKWTFSAINGSYTTNSIAPSPDPVANVAFNFGPIGCGGTKGFLNAKVAVSSACGLATAATTVELQAFTNTKCN